MGLFSRKDSASARKPAAKPRPSVTSEAQAAEMRVRARRRLAGAVVLVLTAVIVLPMLLDSEPAPVATNVPIRIPERQAPFGANAPETPALAQPSTAADATPSAQANAALAAVSGEPKPEPKVDPKRNEPPARVEPPQTSAPALSARSADGERALALLEGRPVRPAGTSAAPAEASTPRAPPAAGNFVVQAMSLDSSDDAQRQRGKLLASGVSNAFVDGPVNVNGNQKYRVRVGPFPSRDAAQAAQTRLRTLGYNGAFIASQ